jgi:hypothetical protein
MEKEFVPYELALRMKALSYDEPCFNFYMGGFKELGKIKYVNPNNVAETNVLAPTFSQAFRWFRKNYNLISSIDTIIYGCTLNEQEFHYKIITNTGVGSYGQFGTYEEAELECVKKLIEIVEQKEK